MFFKLVKSHDDYTTLPHPRSKVCSMTSHELSTEPNTMRNVSFAVVDFETTGLNPETDRIVQLAAVIVNGAGDIIDSFDTIVKPESPAEYHHGAEHIHGISAEQVSSGMPLREALEHLWSISAGNVFTAHNAPFDLGFLHAESERVGIEGQVEIHIDTLELSRRTTGTDTTRRHNLFALCEHYGIERDQVHDAKSDATATAQLLMHLIKELGVETPDQVSELFAR
ncbi:MAG: 3'-5' exonuclease [Ilumatobacteraceae bacterium]|nr:3'-5' exonuclease [Ilumatobacteraceae bacterium]